MAIQTELKEKVTRSPFLELFRQRAKEKRQAAKQQDTQSKMIIPTKVEYSNEIVLTTDQLAQFYECDANNIKKNFNANKDRFIEGKHYFKVEGESLKVFKASFVTESDVPFNKFAPSLYLWTKRGAARHAKMLSTDKAWQVFEMLEDSYFTQVKKDAKPMTQAEIIAAIANQAVEHERLLKAQQQQIFALRTEQENQGKEQSYQRQQLSSLKQDIDTLQDIVTPSYSNVNKEWSQQLAVSVYYLAGRDETKMTEYWTDIQTQFCQTFSLDIGIELERAKEFLRSLYYREKEIRKNPSKDILRPAAIQQLSFCAMVTMKSEWYFAVKEIVESFRNNE